NLLFQCFEGFRIAKKTCHVNKHVRVKRRELLGIVLNKIKVGLQRLDSAEHHASHHSPLKSAGLVEREIHAPVIAQQSQDLLQATFLGGGGLSSFALFSI